jgi:hypothetical protein
MAEIFNKKFYKWFELAKQIVKDKPSVLTALNEDQFVAYLNYDMPIQVQLSKDYVKKLSQRTPDGICDEARPNYEAFQEWWKKQKADQQIAIYDKLKMNGNTTYQRELEILSRRFTGWGKQDHLKLDADVKVTSTLGDKLRKISKTKVDNG